MKSSTTLLSVVSATFACLTAAAQGTYTAASCNYSDVSSLINGPTHTAVNGDTINVPAGSCIWQSGLTVPSNIGINLIGAGAGSTIITDGISSHTQLVTARPTYGSATFRMSGFTFQPQSTSTNTGTPFAYIGTCTPSGCPNIRIDHNTFSGWSVGGNSFDAYALQWVTNVFGVIDHNTLAPIPGSYVEFVNASHASYFASGGVLGDPSWVAGQSLGTANAIYVENNTLSNGAFFTDCDHSDTVNNTGGCRMVVRFNTNSGEVNGAADVQNHGTESGGRLRGGYSIESYGNHFSPSQDVAAIYGIRSGTALIWGNTYTLNGGASHIVGTSLYRSYVNFTPWGVCDGSSPYDKNDGTVYASGTYTGSSGSTSFVDSSKNWAANQWVQAGAPYSLHNVTKNFGGEIAANGTNTITFNNNPECNWGSHTQCTWNNGDVYQILRATVCLDQPGYGGGSSILYTGFNPVPASWANEKLTPIYQWDEATGGSGGVSSQIDIQTARMVQNRDYYFQPANQGGQTSPTAPFNGTGGVGYGTLANRPTTCTAGVAYWATDQGSWNASGVPYDAAGNQQGELFVCGAGNTWNLYYTPYTYPHPLVQGTTPPPGPPSPPPTSYAPPTSVLATSH